MARSVRYALWNGENPSMMSTPTVGGAEGREIEGVKVEIKGTR